MLALYRDKDGRSVTAFPFILAIDPISNRGRLFQDEAEMAIALMDEEDRFESAEAHNVLRLWSEAGRSFHYLRSEADLEDELFPYLAVADGQLQEAMSALWVGQSFDFPEAELIDWAHTTTQLWTDGERVRCDGHQVRLLVPADDPRAPQAEAAARRFLTAYAREVAEWVRAPLAFAAHVPEGDRA